MKIFFDTEFTDLVGIVYGIQLISANYDWQLLAEFLEEQQAWPGNLMRETSVSRLFNHYQAIENYFAYQPMAIRHHALWDARALAWAWRQGEPK